MKEIAFNINILAAKSPHTNSQSYKTQSGTIVHMGLGTEIGTSHALNTWKTA